MKDRFSTLNQGTGVYIFDHYVKKVRGKGYKMCGQFHDEIIFAVPDTEESKAQVTLDLNTVIKEINKEIKLNRDMEVDVQFGKDYSLIH